MPRRVSFVKVILPCLVVLIADLIGPGALADEPSVPFYVLYGAEDRLAADYPAGGHDFPLESRRRAYAWFDRFLKP